MEKIINKIKDLKIFYKNQQKEDEFYDELNLLNKILFRNNTENQIKLFLKLKENLESNLIEKEEKNTKESALMNLYFKNEKNEKLD